MKKRATIYLLDCKMKWKTFKLLSDRIVVDKGPTPVNGTKVLWKMMRDRQIYCWYSNKIKGDMGLGIKLPKNVDVKILSSPTN